MNMVSTSGRVFSTIIQYLLYNRYNLDLHIILCSTLVSMLTQSTMCNQYNEMYLRIKDILDAPNIIL